jgi:hypothetical protein
MMALIPASVQFIWMLWLAQAESYSDWRKIKNGVPIDHISGWLWRAGSAIVVAAALSIHAGSWLTLLGVALVSYGAFSPAFRFMLNKRRGLHWNYIAPGNLYDWAFLRPWMAPIDRTECVEAWHIYMASWSALQAGKTTYSVEITALVLGIYITTL